MTNTCKGAYTLTLLCPIRAQIKKGISGAVETRQHIESMPRHQHSPLAKVPNTYLARFFILDNVIDQGAPANKESLKSKYLGFTCNFYGDLDTYLHGFWANAQSDIQEIWQHCYGFEKVNDATSFVHYIKQCQLQSSFCFNGSVDDEKDISLDEQLKALYLKQEFGKFVWQNQGQSRAQIKQSFENFIQRTQPEKLTPRWAPGMNDLTTDTGSES